MLLPKFTYYAPEKLDELCKLCLKVKDYRLKAGGTFLVNNLKALKRREAKTPANIISLYKIAELKGIEKNKDSVVIKAMTTLTETAESKLIVDNLAVIKKACLKVGNSN